MLLKKIYLSNKAGRTICTCLQTKKIPRQKGEPGSPSGPIPKSALVQCIPTTPSPQPICLIPLAVAFLNALVVADQFHYFLGNSYIKIKRKYDYLTLK